jgi:tetratricopeptide (TPR) repeat protein
VSCLDPSTLEQYAARALSGPAAHDAEFHLDRCTMCRRALAQLAEVSLDAATMRSPQQVTTVPGHSPALAAPSSGITGDRLGRYVLHGTLGAGGMGVVYEAYDPDLDRRVALKILRASDDPESRARFLREAQAMARLDHPNVITVYDVGVAGDQAYIAMELVVGGTLRPWIEAQRRPWREVVARFAAAGRGLAAAHAAGIVHRDFKPDNVLVSTSGAVRVTDFGLARTADAGGTAVDVAGSSSGLLDAALTATGAVLGTPAYMAPEQYAGTVIDAASDQFAFCVALFEALYGVRPFSGDTPRALAVATSTGAIREVTGEVPAWLRRVVVRGLAADRAQRWPSMDALLDALGADPAARRRRHAMAALAVVATASGLGAAWYAGAGARELPCQPDAAAFAGVWDAAQRARVAAAFTATGAGFAAETFARIAADLDARTQAWSSAVRVACEDTRVRRTATEPILERRMACLTARRDDLRALVAQLGQVDARSAAEAPGALARLATIDGCADLERLLDAEPPPSDPRLADARRQLADARAAAALGLADKAATLARAALPVADEIGWQTLRGELQLVIGRSMRNADRRAEAQAALAAAAWAADAARDDQTRAEAWMELAELGVLDPDRGPTDRALDLAAAVVRRRGDPALSNQLDRSRATILAARGSTAEALVVAQRAHAWLLANRGPEHPDTLDAELDVTTMTGDMGRAHEVVDQLARLIEALRRAYGASHPTVATAHLARGVALGKLFRADEIEPDFAAALAILRAAYGDGSAPVADALSALGSARLDNGKVAPARKAFAEALAIRRRLHGDESVEVAQLVGRLGAALRVAGDAAGAAEHLRRARETIVRVFGEHQGDLPYLAAEEIEALLALGRSAEARDRARWYVAITGRITGETSFFTAIARAGAAHVILETRGDPAEAARLIESSWSHLSIQPPLDVAPQHYNLARAHWRMGHHDQARALMEKALRAYTDAGADFAAEQAEVKAWLRAPS